MAWWLDLDRGVKIFRVELAGKLITVRADEWLRKDTCHVLKTNG